jgi:transposase
MIRPGFLSSADRIELEAGVGRQHEDHGIARRANTILLLDDGESCARIAKFLYLDDDTIRGWYKSYRQDGWDALAFDGWKGGQSRLKQAQEGALCAWLEARFCRSTYPTQKLFTEAILKFFRKIIPEQWHNFRNQVTENFRIFSEQNLRVFE